MKRSARMLTAIPSDPWAPATKAPDMPPHNSSAHITSPPATHDNPAQLTKDQSFRSAPAITNQTGGECSQNFAWPSAHHLSILRLAATINSPQPSTTERHQRRRSPLHATCSPLLAEGKQSQINQMLMLLTTSIWWDEATTRQLITKDEGWEVWPPSTHHHDRNNSPPPPPSTHHHDRNNSHHHHHNPAQLTWAPPTPPPGDRTCTSGPQPTTSHRALPHLTASHRISHNPPPSTQRISHGRRPPHITTINSPHLTELHCNPHHPPHLTQPSTAHMAAINPHRHSTPPACRRSPLLAEGKQSRNQKDADCS